MSGKIGKSQVTIHLQATIYLLGTSAQIYKIANLKVLVPVLYVVALSEPKMKIQNKTRWSCTKTCCMHESFHLSPISA